MRPPAVELAVKWLLEMSKVVLVSESGYSSKHDSLLLSFLDQKVDWFFVVGKDCVLWEEVMDELAVGNGENPRYITTTSHPNETEKEVMGFARIVGPVSHDEIRVVRI